MKAQGIEPTNYELHTSWALPSEEICRFFSITDEKKILKLERLRGNPEFPFVYFISYFNPRIGLTGNEDFSRPLYEILEQDYSSVAKFRKKKSVPSLPTNFWLRSLKSSPGTLYSSENDLYMTRGDALWNGISAITGPIASFIRLSSRGKYELEFIKCRKTIGAGTSIRFGFSNDRWCLTET